MPSTVPWCFPGPPYLADKSHSTPSQIESPAFGLFISLPAYLIEPYEYGSKFSELMFVFLMASL